MKWIWTSLALALGCATSFGASLTERDVIFTALSRNPNIVILKLDSSLDSLKLLKTALKERPRMTFSISPYVVPFDSIQSAGGTFTSGENSARAGINAGTELSKTFGGGGQIKLELGQNVSRQFNDTTLTWKTSYSLSLSQPLIAGAWNNGEVAYEMAISRIDHQQFSLKQQLQLLEQLTEIRTLYWSYYRQKMLYSVVDSQLSYALQYHNIILKRFQLGEVAEIETLSTAMELLQATREKLRAENELLLAANKLATSLMISPDSIDISDSVELSIIDLPSSDSLLAMVRIYHPKPRLFDLMRRGYELQRAHVVNNLLPELLVRATIGGSRLGDSFFSSQLQRSDNLVISLFLNYSIPTTNRRIDAKALELQSQKIDQTQLEYELSLKAQAEELKKKWQQQKVRLALDHAAQQVARKKFEASLKGYALGSVGRLELQKDRNDFATAQANYITGIVEMKMLEIVIEEITGLVLNRFGVKIQ